MSGKAEWMEGMSDAETFAALLFSHGFAYGSVEMMEELIETGESKEAFDYYGLAPIVPRWADTAVGIAATFDDGSVMAFDTHPHHDERFAVGAWETLGAEEWAKALTVAGEFAVVWADTSDDSFENEWMTHGAGRGQGGGDGWQNSAVCDACGFDLPFLFRVPQPVADRPHFLCHLCLKSDGGVTNFDATHHLPAFKHACGFQSSDEMTVEIINSLTAECPSCEGAVDAWDFISR